MSVLQTPVRSSMWEKISTCYLVSVVPEKVLNSRLEFDIFLSYFHKSIVDYKFRLETQNHFPGQCSQIFCFSTLSRNYRGHMS